MRNQLLAIYAALAVLNAIAWSALLGASHAYPMLLALGITAFLLGLRHAVDPDHIAAIDTATRALMQRGERPAPVGFFFSLGHSTIVVALSLLIAFLGAEFKDRFPALTSTGTVLGASISAVVLLILAAANVSVLLSVWRDSRSHSNGRNDAPMPGGVLTRLLRPSLSLVKKSSHMYLIGLLFGLGFDTATEIALLGIAALSGASGMPVTYVLILPFLFAAGMSLVDSTEGIAALGAYRWACLQPARKLSYNVAITILSIALALVIGGAEATAAITTGLAGHAPAIAGWFAQ